MIFSQRFPRTRCLLFALCALAGVPVVRAQSLSPTLSVAQPGAGIADSAEPWSIVVNPAALAFSPGWLFGLRHTEIVADSGLLGTGTGLYLSRPIPYLHRVSLGGSLEILRPGQVSLPSLMGRVTAALGVRAFSWLGLGLSFTHVAASQLAWQGGLSTLHVGARATLGPHVALGLLFHDLAAPTVPSPDAGQRAASGERGYELEALFRPLGDHRLELAPGLRLGETTLGLWPKLRLWVRPARGVSLGLDAQAVWRPRAAASDTIDYRISVGFGFDFAQIGAQTMALVGSAIGQPTHLGFQGGSLAVRVSSTHYPSVYRGSQRLVRVELGDKSGPAWIRLLTQLRALSAERSVRGILLIPSGFQGGWAQAEELRGELQRLREAGKRVIVYAGGLSTKAYYVAALADRVYLDPDGDLRLQGLGKAQLFLKDALARIGVRADLLRIGQYKATPERFTHAAPSEPAQQQSFALLDDVYRRLVRAVAQGRHRTEAQIEQAIAHGLFTPPAALAAGLLDGVVTGEGVERALEQIFQDRLPLVELTDPVRHPISDAPVGVAVVEITGDIMGGRSRALPLLDQHIAGGSTLSTALQDAASSSHVRALVIRIDSPGGSASVSESLARQIEDIATRKPVVCSLGDVAASGGYMIASACPTIFAEPSTTTGSIGIFGGKVDLSGLLSQISLHTVRQVRGEHADVDSVYRPYSEAERALLLATLQHGYNRFVERVAKSRKLTLPAAEQVAQGRVMTGEMASAQGLVDHLGSITDAIALARARGGLPLQADGPLFFYPQVQPTLVETLLTLSGLHSDEGGSRSPQTSDLERVLTQALRTLAPGLRGALLFLENAPLCRMEAAPIDE